MGAILISMALETSLRMLAGHEDPPGEPYRSSLATARQLRNVGYLDDDDLEIVDRILQVRDLAIHGYKITNGQPALRDACELTGDVLRLAGLSPKA